MNNNFCFARIKSFFPENDYGFVRPFIFQKNARFDLEGDEQAQADGVSDYKSETFRFFYLFTSIFMLVEVNGFEPMASCVQGRRSPN